ncbi:hypothetical protein FACS1894105_14000 [Clostridia bacterium]|nr:hypothetical protein FACS1894105_14000 [Clostridia bacterium]
MKYKLWNWARDYDEERVLYFCGSISDERWFDDDITPAMFKAELFADRGDVTIWMSSPGGDVISASQIYDMLRDYPGNVTIKISGIAASAATVVAMAGNSVLMAPTALMLLHNPSAIAVGDADEMRKTIELLEAVKESIINAYQIKSKLPREQLSQIMNAGKMLTAQDAIALGLADDILKARKMQPSAEPPKPDGVAADLLDKRLSLILH